MGKILRRTFLIGSTAIVGGAAFGYYQVTKKYPNPLEANLAEGETALTPYVLIDKKGITLISPRAEMGQGVRTTLAALVAEELDVSLESVNVIHGPASKAYYNAALLEEAAGKAVTDESAGAERMRGIVRVVGKMMGNQTTGGSSSTPDAYERMRKAGAAARYALLKAASKQLNQPISQLTTENGYIISPDGTKISYTEFSEGAAKIKLPAHPPLKPKSQWKLLGKSLDRLDMVEKVTGTAQYAMDVRLPGMLYATVKTNPHLGAGLIDYDGSKATASSSVKQIVPIDNGLAVIATNSWAAFKAIEEIDFNWEKASYPETTKDMVDGVAAVFDEKPDSTLRDDGDVEAALSDNDNDQIEMEYSVPYLAHSTMEPMNAVAHFREGKLDIWVGSQAPTRCVTIAEELTGLNAKDITIHNMWLGGGFGRRGETDFVKQAIQIAMATEGTPVKMIWTREEDMRHDVYRPLTLARFKGALKNNKLTAYDMRVASSPAAIDGLARQGTKVNIPDPTIVQNAWDNPYSIENYRVYGYRAPTMLPIGFWRSVGASQNAFFQESAIDELAHKAGLDPIAFRLELLNHNPSRKVLETVRDMADWGSPLPSGHSRGVAFYLSFGVPTAQIIEVAQTPQGLKMVNAYIAADVGIALDPRNVEAQLHSGMVYGLTAAIMGEITVEDGQVIQSNFHDYDALRMYQTPDIHVKILENGSKIRGIGEPGTPPAAPALGNAIFALTGKRLRSLPFHHNVDFV